MFESGRLRIKDPFCGVSHGIGAVLSVAALVTLLIVAAGRTRETIAFAIYGSTLIILYSASCLYHSLMVADHHVERLKRLDHIGIFLLIAGTYTPVCLVSLRGPTGWWMLIAEWGMETSSTTVESPRTTVTFCADNAGGADIP